MSAVSAHPDLQVTSGLWQVVDAGSVARFTVRKLGVHTVRGTMPVARGTVRVTDGQPVTAAAEVLATGISTGIRRRDLDLQDEPFLDAAAHPIIGFASSTIAAAVNGWTVEGTLSVRGQDSPLRLAVQVTQAGEQEARVLATGVVDRFAAGVRRGPAWLIGREVGIRVEALLRRTG